MGEKLNDSKKESYGEKLSRLLSEPGLIDRICSHVASGGTLIDLCETWDVRYGDVVTWINTKDENRFEKYRRALDDRTEWVKETLLAELRTLGLSDLRQAFDEKGNLKPVHEMPKAIARAIASVEVDELFAGTGKEREFVGYTRKVKFWDKPRAIEMIMKNLGMLIDRHLVSGTRLEDILTASNAKPEPPPDAPAEKPQ